MAGLKVLIVHNHYKQHGGESAVVQAETELLRGLGHEVVLYSRDNHEIDDYGVLDRAAFFPSALFSRRTYGELTDLVRQQRPDVAHVHNVFPLISPAAYVALDRARVPIVQTVHNFRFLCPNGLFFVHGALCERCKTGNTLPAIQRRCYRNSYPLSALYALIVRVHRQAGTLNRIDRFIALNPFVKAKLIEGGVATEDKLSVLGHFLPDPWPSLPSAADRRPYALFLGRLGEEKGAATLIEAARLVPELAVRIAGEGPAAEELRRLAHARQASNVEFLGDVKGTEKWDLLRHATALVVPSLCYETFSLAMLEGMASGCAIVASRLGSLAALIEDGKTGLLFAPGDSVDLAAKLRALINDKPNALALGHAARARVEGQATAAIHGQRLLEIYQQAIRDKV
jgi:glycosyltransferase involved in cell wall biosynthesis